MVDSTDQLDPDLWRGGSIHDDSDAGTDMTVASIAFATAVVNLRHVFYGLSLIRSSAYRRLEKMADCLFADR